MEQLDAIVIGGGQAGLAAGYHLQRAGLRFVILEAAEEATGSWKRYYDSLTLFSPARYSSLPGMRFPGNPDRYPTRDEVVVYPSLNYALGSHSFISFGPVFKWNHDRLMRSGGRGLARRLGAPLLSAS